MPERMNKAEKLENEQQLKNICTFVLENAIISKL